VPEAVEGRELVRQLAREGAAPERADVHGEARRRLARDLEDRVRNVEPAA
jgi:hypothetical protein